jgi:hypothetical protein
MRVFVRYETPNKNGDTRRARNDNAGEPTPAFVVPEIGQFLWDIYQRISRSVSRTHDGYYRLINPSEYLAWFQLTGTLVYPVEYDILTGMDCVYCDEANKELEDIRSQQNEEQKRELEKNQRGSRRGK